MVRDLLDCHCEEGKEAQVLSKRKGLNSYRVQPSFFPYSGKISKECHNPCDTSFLDRMKNCTMRAFRITTIKFLRFLAVFVVAFTATKFGQYLYSEWGISPAVLWPTAGISIAMIWLMGYRYAIPIFLALMVATTTDPNAYYPFATAFPAAIVVPIGCIASYLAAVYLLKQSGFRDSFLTLKDILLFVSVTMVSFLITPTFITLMAALFGELAEISMHWDRAWAGHVFSAVVLFPFIISWVKPASQKDNYLIMMPIGLLLLAAIYLTFWIQASPAYALLSYAALFGILLWFGFWFSTRIVSLAVVTAAVGGISGLFFMSAPEANLNDQLIKTELFFLLIIPVCYAFLALVKERTNTIEELKLAMERIEKQSDAKNKFIAILAHELRNPLAPVRTTLEILDLQDLEQDTKKLVSHALAQLYTMRRLLDDLLDITRITQGKFQLQIAEVNLCDFLRKSIESTKHIFEERKHELVVDRTCDESIFLNVDPVRFEQVIINLLNNAAKYTNPGGRVEIRCNLKGNILEIQVKDNGLGIKEEHLGQVFDSYWQKDKTTTGLPTGIGVGLSLTKHIVEMHGGTIRAESAGLGKGSTFTVFIPFHQSLKQALQTVVREPKQPLTQLKVLVGDDNRAAADALSKLLGLKGYISVVAYSGQEILDAVEVFKPDIILLDIGLPDMSGYEVTQRLRIRGFDNKIFALSGYGQEDNKRKAKEAGFDYHFTKPMSIESFEKYMVEIGMIKV
jgi:signal transduction histidine kinase/CheY-like chemotaxis protein